MNRITQLVYGRGTVSELMRQAHREPDDLPDHLIAYSDVRIPVVFWNVTARCNLRCAHCYLGAGPVGREKELDTTEARALIDDLVGLRVPLLILSGGEPLLREDLWELLAHAWRRNLRVALSTNGTLLTPDIAERLKGAGVVYAGISLDGARPEIHDAFRGCPGAFERSLAGIRSCVAAGLRCGVRFTAMRSNLGELEPLIELSHRLKVPRFCVYWLVPSGRGTGLSKEQLAPVQARWVLDTLLRFSEQYGPEQMELLSVDGPQDGVYILDRLKKARPEEWEEASELVKRLGGGCSAGERVASIDPEGNVYPCQFAQHDRFRIGNLRNQPLSRMWRDPENSVLKEFRTKRARLEGDCRECPSLPLCGGGCRIRAYAATGNIWSDDPLCLLNAGENS